MTVLIGVVLSESDKYVRLNQGQATTLTIIDGIPPDSLAEAELWRGQGTPLTGHLAPNVTVGLCVPLVRSSQNSGYRREPSSALLLCTDQSEQCGDTHTCDGILGKVDPQAALDVILYLQRPLTRQELKGEGPTMAIGRMKVILERDGRFAMYEAWPASFTEVVRRACNQPGRAADATALLAEYRDVRLFVATCRTRNDADREKLLATLSMGDANIVRRLIERDAARRALTLSDLQAELVANGEFAMCAKLGSYASSAFERRLEAAGHKPYLAEAANEVKAARERVADWFRRFHNQSVESKQNDLSALTKSDLRGVLGLCPDAALLLSKSPSAEGTKRAPTDVEVFEVDPSALHEIDLEQFGKPFLSTRSPQEADIPMAGGRDGGTDVSTIEPIIGGLPSDVLHLFAHEPSWGSDGDDLMRLLTEDLDVWNVPADQGWGSTTTTTTTTTTSPALAPGAGGHERTAGSKRKRDDDPRIG